MRTELNSLLLEQVRLLPRVFLTATLIKKLTDKGVSGDQRKIAEAICDHLLSGNKGEFVWSESDGVDEHVELQITSGDIDKILAGIQTFLKDELPDVIERMVTEAAQKQLRKAQREWPTYYVWERGQQQIFKGNIELRWGKGLGLLRLLLSEARQVGELKHRALLRSKAKKHIRKREVIVLLHVRACQTASEIITLVENGYADGAMARWRTLYELRVVGGMIAKFGDEAAERYLDHEHVSRKQELDNDLRHLIAGSDQVVDPEYRSIIEENFKAVLKEYGGSFATPYGWASCSLNCKKPVFHDLEAAVGLPEIPPTYKMASYRVHAGVAGLLSGLGQLGGRSVLIAGASNAGLETPAINTAYTLVQLTGLLFEELNRLEDQIHMTALAKLRDELEKEFVRAERRLIKDESQVRG